MIGDNMQGNLQQQKRDQRRGFTPPHFFRSLFFRKTKIRARDYVHDFFSVNKSGAGFTLIELLVVAAIFSVTVLVATTVFVRVQVTQREIASRQRVVADGRYVLEAVARVAKLGVPDFAFYESSYCDNDYGACDLAEPQSMLVVRDQTNIQTCYRWIGGNLETTSGDPDGTCYFLAPQWSDITPADLRIDDFRIYVKPNGDPFRSPPAVISDCQPASNFNEPNGVCECMGASDCHSGQTCQVAGTLSICKNPDTQPTVAIYLQTTSSSPVSGISPSSTMETIVTSRVYRR